MPEYRRGAHTIFEIHLHLVWITKYRKKFLRGALVTDATGKAQFTTIYPGWYQGRAVHIHFKVRTLAANGRLER